MAKKRKIVEAKTTKATNVKKQKRFDRIEQTKKATIARLDKQKQKENDFEQQTENDRPGSSMLTMAMEKPETAIGKARSLEESRTEIGRIQAANCAFKTENERLRDRVKMLEAEVKRLQHFNGRLETANTELQRRNAELQKQSSFRLDDVWPPAPPKVIQAPPQHIPQPRMLRPLDNVTPKQRARRISGQIDDLVEKQQIRIGSPIAGQIAEKINPSLNSMDDLLLTTELGLTLKQRERLKHFLRKRGHDFMAGTTNVKKLKKDLASIANFGWQKEAFICTNIKNVLQQRLQTLLNNRNFVEYPQHREKILLIVTGDRGGDISTTKIGIMIGCVEKANSPNNILIVGLYPGDDNYWMMKEQFKPIFAQLAAISHFELDFGEDEKQKKIVKVDWRICSDLKFGSALFGHQGTSSNFPCICCEAKRLQIQKGNINSGPIRPIDNTMNNAAKSFDKPPLVHLPCSAFIPPAFHLMHGLGGKVLSFIEDYAKVCGREQLLGEVLKLARARKDPRTKNFTGVAIHKLFTGNFPQKMTEKLGETPTTRLLISLSIDMQTIYKFSDKHFLFASDVKRMEEAMEKFKKDFLALKEHFDQMIGNGSSLKKISLYSKIALADRACSNIRKGKWLVGSNNRTRDRTFA